jgi:hypothetical protein
MNRDEAIAAIRVSALGDRLERLLPHLLPSVRIDTARDPASARVLVSRFGGFAALPPSLPWPEWNSGPLHERWIAYSVEASKQRGVSQRFWNEQIARYEGLVRDNPKPIHFVAMIRLAEAAPHASLVGLPSDGTLLFFYDVERSQGSFWPEARGAWRVIYAPEDTDLRLVEKPPAHIPEFVPSRLSFTLQYSLPEDLRSVTGDDDLCVYGNPDYEAVHATLLGGAARAVIHQLGGAPQEVQHDLFRTCQLASSGVDCGRPEDNANPRVKQLESGAADWRLILQIDSDDEGPGWMWGDSGRLYFCLREDDLTHRRFDRAWCVEQCC